MQTRVDFTPSWMVPKADESGGKPTKGKGAKAAKVPVFHLRLGDILERSSFEAELGGVHQAGEVPRFLMVEAAVAGVRHLLPEGEDRDQLIELLESDEDSGDPAEARQRKDAHDILSKHWPAYKGLLERTARREALLPTLAFLTFVDGWSHVPGNDGGIVEFARDAHGDIRQDLVAKISPLVIRSVGVQAYNLQYGRGEAKNSAPPSS